MSITRIGSADAATDILAMLRRREAEALKRLSEIPEGADDVSLFSASSAYAEAKKAADAATAMLSGATGQSEAA